MSNPLVTIGMVTYNSERYIEDAITSVLSSSYTNFELIVCDDCSTDTTIDKVKSFKDPRIKLYTNKINLKEYPNRNKIITLADGEYFIFIDGDDMIYPHGLDFMVRMLHAFPTCAMALMAKRSTRFYYPIVVTPHQFYVSHFLGESFLRTAFTSILFRTSVLKEVRGLSEDYPNGDDFIRLKIANSHNSLVINDNITWWRQTPGQASSNLSKHLEFYFLRQRMYHYFLNDTSCPLSEDEKMDAFFNIRRVEWQIIIGKIKRFKFTDALKLIKGLNLPIHTITCYFKSRKIKDPFSAYSPVKPLRVSFADNPFSNIYSK
ncbi:glycosyltransferase family 2 protein [Pontibacter qinzhouensis]|uniref:Glycosyltransferase family 2 protein n=1 Tax=Pontibacter qinzhouensis TaxID=2603253 RepID=A0A5C8K8Q0_9BACT|nr:glycosyltransferase family A protein [Pontibacter qinzhouensis]TXK46969.1 glycosyltransferase family 2 protein [Pontibacter qinzhouensis]